MNFLSSLTNYFNKADAADVPEEGASPQSLVVSPAKPYVNQKALDEAGLRTSMWVVTADGHVGILTGCDADEVVEVTRSKPDGSNLMELDANDKAVPARVFVAVGDVRQAYIAEIPESRRPSVDALVSLGYGRAS
jgi:hypothetical protein